MIRVAFLFSGKESPRLAGFNRQYASPQVPNPPEVRLQLALIRQVLRIARSARMSGKPGMLVVFLMTLASVLGTAIAFASGMVYNQLLTNAFSTAALWILFTCVLDLVTQCLIQISQAYSIRYHHAFRLAISEDLFSRALKLPLEAVRDGQDGELMSRVTTDADSVGSLICYVLLPIGEAAVTVLVSLVFMLCLNPVLAVCSLAFVPLWLVQLKPDSRLDGLRSEVFRHSDQLRMLVSDCLTSLGLTRVKAFDAASFEVSRFRVPNKLLSAASIRYADRSLVISYFLSASANILGSTTSLAAGAYLVASGQISVGTLITVLVLIARIHGPLQTLANASVSVSAYQSTLARVSELQEAPVEAAGDTASSGDIEASGLSFNINGRLIIRSLDFYLASGASVAIAGRNGVGKSTLAKLLVRLFSFEGPGKLTMGRVPYSRLNLQTLKANVVLLPQSDVLIVDTLRNNVCYGLDCEVFEDDVLRVLEVVGLGKRFGGAEIDSQIGAIGVNLSSGERQRIALARALLRRPKLLIIDEATSSIDVESERQILQYIMEQCGVIFISHRKENLDLFPQVIAFPEADLVDTAAES